jgi:hypothetical protein
VIASTNAENSRDPIQITDFSLNLARNCQKNSLVRGKPKVCDKLPSAFATKRKCSQSSRILYNSKSVLDVVSSGVSTMKHQGKVTKRVSQFKPIVSSTI